MTPTFYITLPSAFGTFSVVWREIENAPKICRVFLSDARASSEDSVQTSFPGASRRSHQSVISLGGQIQGFLEGNPISFELDLMALETCSEFQRSVLLAEHAIPRGWISTYGKIAEHLGVENGARAVGSALARNPFPIVIPCHRAIRSNGELGGYQGGLAMKRALLAFEGIEISQAGKVITQSVYY
jgi:methylated-DNA-[protein]-cysteine S-methyltransferase